MTIKRGPVTFEYTIPVVIVGGGACGLTAALAAREAGADVLLLEREPSCSGTTAMSSGLIPAAGTRAQREAGIADDDPALFAADLCKKTQGALEQARAEAICRASTVTVDWLIDQHQIPLTLFMAGGALPGHSKPRLHGTPNRTGEELVAALERAAEDLGVDILTDARVSALFAAEDNTIVGVEVSRPDGTIEQIGCETLILASCGFASNRKLVEARIPELAGILSHSHPGAQGDALIWGEELGAATNDLAAYQGHANLASGQGLLVSWLSVAEGGFQINRDGDRFSDESLGYSEQAVHVNQQPESFAWTIYDARIDQLMQEIAEYRDVKAAGAIIAAETLGELAGIIRVPLHKLEERMAEIEQLVQSGQPDRFGRRFTSQQALQPPYRAVKVTPALFHTQGGLEVDDQARVLSAKGGPLPNLFAGGGAARGVSGPGASGYVAGNGLMTATSLGRLAGEAAAAQVLGKAAHIEDAAGS